MILVFPLRDCQWGSPFDFGFARIHDHDSAVARSAGSRMPLACGARDSGHSRELLKAEPRRNLQKAFSFASALSNFARADYMLAKPERSNLQ